MEAEMIYGNAGSEPQVAPTMELTRLDKELQLMETRSKAQFALTPVGQALKQFEVNQRMGQMYAQSTIVPDTYNVQGNYARLLDKERKSGNSKPDHAALWAQAQGTAYANCAIAVDMATRMKANPVMVMQNLYIVHGNPAWSSKFLIATINTCGRFEPLRYESNGEKGDNYGVRCYTYLLTDRDHKERLEGTWVTWKMVKAEGWNTKSGSKWNTMPEQMFRYRAAAFWQRMYAPEISMGFNTVEEQQDIVDVQYTEVSTGAPLPQKKAAAASIADLALQNASKAQEPAPLKAEGEFKPVDIPASEEQTSSPAPAPETTEEAATEATQAEPQAPKTGYDNVDPFTGEIFS